MNSGIFKFVQGIVIGAGAILPGISGASLAVVFGVYEEFIQLLTHPLKNIKPFLSRHVFLVFGIAAGFIVFTLLLNSLFNNYQTEVVFIFSGFITGTLPGIFRRAKKEGIDNSGIFSFCLCTGIFIFIAMIGKNGNDSISILRTAEIPKSFPFGIWMLAGAIIGIGSLMPGISASFFLMAVGMYGPLLDAFANRSILSGIQIGAGALISLLLFSHLVEWLYKEFHGIVSFAVLGCTLGSLILVFPGFTTGLQALTGIALILIGFAASFFLERSI